MESLGQVSRLSVGHSAEPADETTGDKALLALEGADLETDMLWLFEDFVGNGGIECLGGILACDGTVYKHDKPA